MTSYGPDHARTGAQNARSSFYVDPSREAGRSTLCTERASANVADSQGGSAAPRALLTAEGVLWRAGQSATNPLPKAHRRTRVTGTHPRRRQRAALPWLLDKIGQGLFFLIQFAGAILFFGGVFAVMYLVAALNDVYHPERQTCTDHLAGTEYQCSRIELPRLENSNE